MACFQGIPDWKCWWSKEAISPYSGAPFRLNNAMFFTRYLEITAALQFTDVRTPTVERDGYEDRFHEVRKMIDEFNNHYAHSYHPSWLNCLDESMSSWLNKFCPGFMCVPCKPHLFGNEYHSIADGDDGKSIMWRVKLVEGKDRPKKAGGQWVFPTEFPGYGKTTMTMLEMTKPIHGKGKVVVGDSGFCVREGVVECHKWGVWFQVTLKSGGTGRVECRGLPSICTLITWSWGIVRPLSQNMTTSHFSSIAAMTQSTFQKSCQPTACLRWCKIIQLGGRSTVNGSPSSIQAFQPILKGKALGQ